MASRRPPRHPAPQRPANRPAAAAAAPPQPADLMFCTVGDLLTMLNEAVRLRLNVPTNPNRNQGEPV